jgi:hypothetical protein
MKRLFFPCRVPAPPVRVGASFSARPSGRAFPLTTLDHVGPALAPASRLSGRLLHAARFVCLAALIAAPPLRSQDKPAQTAAAQSPPAQSKPAPITPGSPAATAQVARPDSHSQDARPAASYSLDIRDQGAQLPDDLTPQLLAIKRVFVDRLTGGETAAQLRDMIIGSLQNAKLFILTENQERADVILHGAAEDLIFTDAFQSSEGINAHIGTSSDSASGTSSHYNNASSGFDTRSGRSASAGVGDNSSSNIKERRHEAMATVRLVNKDGDVIWSTTQESTGAKFRGASADVAEKITKQLVADYEKVHNRARPPQTVQ